MGGALDGIRILEFSQIHAGPRCGLHLSELGAEVVKVEPFGGEPTRNAPAGGTGVSGESKRFRSLNRGKKSLVINLKDERGQELMRRIVPGFDVLIINYALRVPKMLGIDYETLSAVHPGLVYCRMTGFGVRGPLADRGSTDITGRAYSGMMVTSGQIEDGVPAYSAPAIADPMTAMAGAMAICAALYRRKISGEGQLIDASLLRSALSLQDTAVMREPTTDVDTRDPLLEEVNRVRARNGSYTELLDAYRGTPGSGSAARFYFRGYLAKDGPLVLGCLTPANRSAAREAIGVTNDPSELPVDDPEAPEYLARIAAFKEQIDGLMRSRTVAEWMDIFDAARVPASPVNLAEEMADDPQVEAEGIMWDMVHEVIGPQRVVGPIVEMSGTPTTADQPAPLLGKHTDELLLTAGLSAEEVADLRAAEVVL